MSFFGLKNDNIVWLARIIAVLLLLLILVETSSIARKGLEFRREAALIELDNRIDPVTILILDERECLGPSEFIISGYLDKTEYPENTEAEFTGMLVYSYESPPRKLPWRRTVISDLSQASRKYGEQGIDFVIQAPCDVVLTIHTQHMSPLTGRTRAMEFGPFYPPVD